MELGLFSFGEVRMDAQGAPLNVDTRTAHLLEEIELADRVGLDVFGLGEHHRPDYMISAPHMILAAAAARTSRIKLTPAVSVLSSADPVRVYQDYATLDLISEGRAELMVGRGSFTESFPLFGQDLADYEWLFEEKLDLLLHVRDAARVSWSGRHRPPIEDRWVLPRSLNDPLPLWIAAGGTPASVARAGRLGLPLALAIIGGQPERFAPLKDLYLEAARRAGHEPSALRFSINAHGFLAADAQEAADLAYPAFADTMDRIGRERGWPPLTRARFEQDRAPQGPSFVGDPDQVVAKILRLRTLFGHDRFLLKLTVGPMPHDRVLEAIELFGTQVAPAVRAAVADAPVVTD